MKYPDYKTYEKQYKRFFKKGVNYLLEKADIKKTDRCIDICGGGGRLTVELTKLSDNVTYLDQEKDMIPPFLKDLGVEVINSSVQGFLTHYNGPKFDKAFCEQAINYWFNYISPMKLAELFNPGGVFIFNTFSQKPSAKPTVREEDVDGLHYVEVNTLVNNSKVNHVQFCEGMEPHFTVFDWIPEITFRERLEPYFDIELYDNGKSAIYICYKK
jgi:SAM-dependent methyltransferase